MAQIERRAYGKTVAVTPNANQRPDLAVQASQAWSSGAGVIGAASFGVLSKVADASAGLAQAKEKKDTDSGAAERQQQDLDGNPTLTEEQLQEHSQAWVRGYKKADGVLAIQQWQSNTAEELAKAEPDTDLTPILKQKLGELMQNFTDPEVRASLLPLAQRAAVAVKTNWQQQSLKESLIRQQESLTGIIRQSFADGSVYKDGALDALYKRLDDPEYAYLNHDDVSKLVIDAGVEAAASGNGYPTKVRDFLQAHGLMDTGRADDVNTAVNRGQHVIAAQQNEARNVALAKMEFNLQDLADRGQLTDKVIRAKVAEAGITPENDPQQYTSTVRYWQNQQDQTLRKWEQDAKERAREARMRVDLSGGNSFNYSDEQISKAMAKRWQETPQNQRGNLIRLAAQNGWEIPQLSRMLQRANPSNAQAFQTAATLYEQLSKVDPKYANKLAGGTTAALLDQHVHNMNDLGLSYNASVAALTAKPREEAEAKDTVKSAWKDTWKQYATMPDGTPRRPGAEAQIMQEAQRIASTNGAIDGAAAIRAAVHQYDLRFTQINGKYVPNIGIPKGAEPALDALLKDLAKDMKRDPGDLSVIPNKSNPAQYLVVDKDGFPIADPTSKGYIGLDPRGVAAAHQKYTADKAEAQARLNQQTAWSKTRTDTPVTQRSGAPLPQLGTGTASPIPTFDPSKPLVPGSTTEVAPKVPERFLDYLKNK